MNSGRPPSRLRQPRIHQSPLQTHLFLQKCLSSLQRQPRTLQCALHFLQPPPQINPPQSPHRAFHRLGRQLFLLVHQNRRQQSPVFLRLRQRHNVPRLRPSLQQRLHQRLRGQSLIQLLRLQRILRLPRRIEFLVRSLASRTPLSPSLHLRSRSQRPDQHALRPCHLRLSRGFHLGRGAVSRGIL